MLATWMEAVAPPRPPERLLEEAFARTMAARQLPVYPWHRVRLGRARGGGAAGDRVRGLALAGVAIALVAALASGVLPQFGQGIVGQPSPTSPPSPSPSAAAPPSPRASPVPSGAPFPSPIAVEPIAAIPITGVIGLATDGASIWLFTNTGDVARIDPVTNAIVATVRPNPENPDYQGLAASATGLWLTDWSANRLYRLDPQTLRTVATIVPAATSKGVIATDAAVWIANTRGGSVERIDPATNNVTAELPLGRIGPSGPNWLTRGFGSIWVGIPNASIVARINERTNVTESTITVSSPASPCGGMAATTTAIWITSCDGSNFLTQIDPVTNKVVGTIDLANRGYGITVIGDRPWTAPNDGQIVRIDPASHAVDRVVSPGPAFKGGGDIVVGAGSVWVSDWSANRVLRLPLDAFGG
ncbi:MAG: hypothetical protein ABIZ72_10010 [Candidatus Limnocylindrales bacterium]